MFNNNNEIWKGSLSTIYWLNGIYYDTPVIYTGVIIPGNNTETYFYKLCTVNFTYGSFNCNIIINWNMTTYYAVVLNYNTAILANFNDATCSKIHSYDNKSETAPLLCKKPTVLGSVITQVNNLTSTPYQYPISLNYTANCNYTSTKAGSQLDAVFVTPTLYVWLLDPIASGWSNWLAMSNPLENSTYSIITCPRRALDPVSNGS